MPIKQVLTDKRIPVKNHFVEVCLDESNQVWVMLHSGSRGIGNAMAEDFIQLARKDMERRMIQLPDRDLAYFPEGTEHFDDYVEAVHWAQEYALQNQECMVDLVLTALKRHLPPFEVTSEVVNCHHNYVAREHVMENQKDLTEMLHTLKQVVCVKG
jgi:tRNA-splicing ligase RtcB